ASSDNTGAELRLTGTCRTPRGPGAYNVTMEGTPVTMVADSIAFTVSGGNSIPRESCTYLGRLTGGQALTARGTVSCTRRGAGTWEMTWGLERGTSIGKLAMIDIGFGTTCALDTNRQARR